MLPSLELKLLLKDASWRCLHPDIDVLRDAPFADGRTPLRGFTVHFQRPYIGADERASTKQFTETKTPWREE